MNNILKKQSGQVLPFFIVAGTILLAVIANLSLRNISSGFRNTTLDTSSRVIAAAEGGLERFLSYSFKELGNMAEVCLPSNTEPACRVDFTPSGQDQITAQAQVSVESFGSVNDFAFTLKKDQVFEVNLDSTGLGGVVFDKNKLYLCWSGDSDVYFMARGSGVPYKDYGCAKDPVGCLSGFSGTKNNTTNPNKCSGPYTNQIKIRDLSSVADLKGLRVRTVGATGDVEAMVHSDSGRLPVQGYKIISVGQISGSGDVQATETKMVKISFPYLPAYFDFGLFSETGY